MNSRVAIIIWTFFRGNLLGDMGIGCSYTSLKFGSKTLSFRICGARCASSIQSLVNRLRLESTDPILEQYFHHDEEVSSIGASNSIHLVTD
jgi:hypothetical protein